MPGVSVTVGEQIAALRKVAGDDVVKRIRREPDPVDHEDRRGLAAQFCARPARRRSASRPRQSFEEIIRIHIEDELGGTWVK